MAVNDLVEQFERGSVAGPFTHRDHVHVAWHLLGKYPLIEALKRVDQGIRQLAQARGRPDIYHQTITWAFVFLIHERMQLRVTDGFEAFERDNPDLFASTQAIVRIYGSEVLDSNLARQTFVLPVGRATIN